MQMPITARSKFLRSFAFCRLLCYAVFIFNYEIKRSFNYLRLLKHLNCITRLILADLNLKTNKYSKGVLLKKLFKTKLLTLNFFFIVHLT